MQNRVRALRTQRNLAQGQLAEAMGVSRQTINSIENERYTPSLPLAIALARYFGLFFLLVGGRSETIKGLTTGRDERFAQIDLKATAAAGLALLLTVIVAFLVAIARGHSGSPYGWLAAIGGLAYVLAVAFFRWRG
jgi:putative transcriptional regulator